MTRDTKQSVAELPIRAEKEFLIFGSPLIGEEEIEEVVATLKSGWVGKGPRVSQFEEMFRGYKKAPYAIALNSCTAALHLACLALKIKPGDEIITTAMTFCATVNSIIHGGATPVLADCERDTMNIDPKDVERKITKRTKAILVIHFAGRPCNMEAILSLAKRHHLKVIEDCAHAIETEYKGKKAGTLGDFGCFSFYVTKNIVTAEGGMIITPHKGCADRIKILSLHGMSVDAWKRFTDAGYKHYYVIECGFKYNMMDLQAALGIQQLKKIENFWQRRQEIWQKYNRAFGDLPVELPCPTEKDTKHAYHLYTFLMDEKKSMPRDEFLAAMTREKIGVGVHYLSIPEHPFYRKRFGWKPKDYPNAYAIGRRTVSLPISPKLTNEDVEDVIGAVRKILRKF